MLTQELIGYAKAIVRERGIAQQDFTPAVCGEVLAEAVRRMDRLTAEVLAGRTDRAKQIVRQLGEMTYIEIVARNAA